MIIKYYNNGWNYIDNVEDVKWINKEINKVVDDNKPIVTGRIYIHEENFNILEDKVDRGIDMRLSEDNNIHVQSTPTNYQIDYDNIEQVLRKDSTAYIRVIVYKKDNLENILLFTHAGYLLNNNGQTIERLG